VSLLEAAGGPVAALTALARTRGSDTRYLKDNRTRDKRTLREKLTEPEGLKVSKAPGALHALPIADRLAFEMALHEEAERRAMDGELAALEAAWRDAEELARISDSLLEPEVVQQKLDALHKSAADGVAPPERESAQ
jgi:hypothetical protein